jgi:hypothetical protein
MIAEKKYWADKGLPYASEELKALEDRLAKLKQVGWM